MTMGLGSGLRLMHKMMSVIMFVLLQHFLPLHSNVTMASKEPIVAQPRSTSSCESENTETKKVKGVELLENLERFVIQRKIDPFESKKQAYANIDLLKLYSGLDRQLNEINILAATANKAQLYTWSGNNDLISSESESLNKVDNYSK